MTEVNSSNQKCGCGHSAVDHVDSYGACVDANCPCALYHPAEQRPSNSLVSDLRILAQNFGDITAQYIRDGATEIERLSQDLATANANQEKFERLWYLRGDEIERLQHELRIWMDATNEWIKANGPGGWIDDLRQRVAELEQQNAYLHKLHQERTKNFSVAFDNGSAHEPPAALTLEQIEQLCSMLDHDPIMAKDYASVRSWFDSVRPTQPPSDALVCVGQLIQLDDGLGTVFSDWNEERFKLEPGTKLYAQRTSETKSATTATSGDGAKAMLAALKKPACTCGDIMALNTVHRIDGPCYSVDVNADECMAKVRQHVAAGEKSVLPADQPYCRKCGGPHWIGQCALVRAGETSIAPAYCKCSFTDPDGTVVPGDPCPIHPEK